MTLTDQLQQRRRELYMTQRGVAKALGLTGAAMSFRERGDSEQIKTLETWARALGCELRLVTEGSSLVCKNCREQLHEDCPGVTWCDCAHRSTAIVPASIGLVDRSAASEREDLRQAKISAGVRLMFRLAEPSQAQYHSMFRESLSLLHRDGLRDEIEQRYAADELARESQEMVTFE